MTHAAAPTFPRAHGGLADPVRSHAVFAIVIAAVVFCTAGLANVPSSWLQVAAESAQTVPGADGAASAAQAATAAPIAAPQAAVHTRQCASCGVVERIRRLEPVGNLPAAFEFTVRLRDGTSRVSSSSGQGSWRTGDRIMLMGGAAAISR